MIDFPGPVSALVTLPVPPGRDGIARVLSLERFARKRLPGVTDTIPAFNRLLVEGSPSSWDPGEVRVCLEAGARAALEQKPSFSPPPLVTLPVCYAQEFAPDLEKLAENSGMTAEDVTGIHSGATYMVLATGFAPGFAYLGDLDERIAMPRRLSPRKRVPAGTVGIADRRTGVYPADSPGGWRLIGRVPPALFGDAAQRIDRFTAGGEVRFRPIDRSDYEAEAGTEAGAP